MPNNPIESSPTTADRRRHKRVQPSGLVYLDMGTENGGIVLDLNEAGAGVQAVAPLQVLSDVSLRFQLPDSPKRIQAEAQVAWVSESRRRVGLHFTDLPEEVLAQIRDWIRSQSPVSEEQSAETALASSPESEIAPPADDANREWPNSLKEVRAEPNSPEASAVPEMEFGMPRGSSLTGEGDAASASLGEFLREIALARSSDRPKAAPEDNDLAPITSGETGVDERTLEPNRAKGDRAAVIHWPAIPAAADTYHEPMALTGAAIPVPKPPTSAATFEKLPVSRPPANPLTARGGGGLWKGAVAVLVLLAASFEAGKWLANGHAPTTRPALEPASQQVARRAESSPSVGVARKRRGPSFRENRSDRTRADVPLSPSSSPAPILPTASSPVHLSSPPPPPVLPNAAPPTVAPAPATLAPPAAAEASASPQVPAPKDVDGRVLTPTDRFNPAHLLYRFDPDYPPDAKQQNVEGTVILRLSIDANGSVDRVQVLSGPSLLVPAATSAVKNWRYLPALLNGQPVKSEQYVSIDFRLPAGDR